MVGEGAQRRITQKETEMELTELDVVDQLQLRFRTRRLLHHVFPLL